MQYFPALPPVSEDAELVSGRQNPDKKSRFVIRVEPYITAGNRPGGAVRFELPDPHRTRRREAFVLALPQGLTAFCDAINRIEGIDDATMQAISHERNRPCYADGMIYSIVPWYPDFTDNRVRQLDLCELRFVVAIIEATFEDGKTDGYNAAAVESWNVDRLGHLHTESRGRAMADRIARMKTTRNVPQNENDQKVYERYLSEIVPYSYANLQSTTSDPQRRVHVQELPRWITLVVDHDDGETVHCKPWQIVLPATSRSPAVTVTMHCQLASQDQLPSGSIRNVPASRALEKLDSFSVTDSPLHKPGTRFGENDIVTFYGKMSSVESLPYDWDDGRPHAVHRFAGVRLVDHIPFRGPPTPALIDSGGAANPSQ